MAMGRTLLEQANDIKKEKGGRKKMGEEPILELLESICEPGLNLSSTCLPAR